MTSGVTIVHPLPGHPIEVMVWADGEVVRREIVSDQRALQIAAELVAAVLSNGGARAN